MNERIKKLRKALDLTQQEFANRIGSVQNTITGYETGRRVPSSQVITLICKTFNVSEAWLRMGEGEMFVKLPRNEALAEQIQSFLHGGSDSFRERLVSLLLRLPPEHWEVLERYALELVNGASAPAAPSTTPDTAQTTAPAPISDPEQAWEREADEFAAKAREQFLLEKRKASQASSANESGSA